MLLEQDTFPAWEKSSCRLLCPHTPPLGPSPPQKAAALRAGSSMCRDAQRSYELHRVTNLPRLQVQVGKMKPSSIERDAMGVDLHLPGSADAQPAPERPPLSGGAGSKWHWDHFSAMCSPRVGDSSPQIFGYSQPQYCLTMENASSFHEMECTAKQTKNPSCT